MDFLKKHINVRFEITGQPQRDEIWDYPLRALREAVTNAICHRDYASSSDIQIKVFDDRIRIWNPGVLPFDLTIEQLRAGEYSSRPRNKLIAQILYDLEIIERYGSGIGRMDEACEEAGVPTAVLEEQAGGFTVIFHPKEQPATDATGAAAGEGGTKLALSRHQVDILRKCRSDSALVDLMSLTGRSDRTKFRHQVLKPILEAGLIEMTIPDKPRSSKQKYRLTDKGRRALSGDRQE
ncbi:ATP-binding protein [Verrucomicrobiota bacterium]